MRGHFPKHSDLKVGRCLSARALAFGQAALRRLDGFATSTAIAAARYQRRRKWRTPVGRDCISLDASLCEWLAERLAFLAHNHNSYPADSSSKDWTIELLSHAMALSVYSTHWDAETIEEENALTEQAQESLRWVADNLPGLWD